MSNPEIQNSIEIIKKELKRLSQYEQLVYFIANDYTELSYEKIEWQRNDWCKRARKLIEQDFSQDEYFLC